MKKLLCLLSILFLCSTQCSYAEMNELDYQIREIRVVKNAKVRPINAQIRKHNENLEKIALDTTLTEQQKNAKFKKEQEALSKLHKQKDAINEQYKKDKKALKKAYRKSH